MRHWNLLPVVITVTLSVCAGCTSESSGDDAAGAGGAAGSDAAAGGGGAAENDAAAGGGGAAGSDAAAGGGGAAGSDAAAGGGGAAGSDAAAGGGGADGGTGGAAGDDASSGGSDAGDDGGDAANSSDAGSCAGTVVGGFCWYKTALGESCTGFCATHGGYDAATETYAGAVTAGDRSNEANCQGLVAALGGNAWDSGTNVNGTNDYGCVDYPGKTQSKLVSDNPTDGASSNTLLIRYCACNQ